MIRRSWRDLHQSPSLAKAQKAVEVHSCKLWVTNLSIVTWQCLLTCDRHMIIRNVMNNFRIYQYAASVRYHLHMCVNDLKTVLETMPFLWKCIPVNRAYNEVKECIVLDVCYLIQSFFDIPFALFLFTKWLDTGIHTSLHRVILVMHFDSCLGCESHNLSESKPGIKLSRAPWEWKQGFSAGEGGHVKVNKEFLEGTFVPILKLHYTEYLLLDRRDIYHHKPPNVLQSQPRGVKCTKGKTFGRKFSDKT